MAEIINERAPKELPVPETMKIAALLAELMPPGALTGGESEPVAVVDSEVAVEGSLDSFDDEQLPGSASLASPSLSVLQPPSRVATTVVPPAGNMAPPQSVRPSSKAEIKFNPEPPKPELPTPAEQNSAKRQPPSEPAAPKTSPEPDAAKPAKAALPSQPADDLIPLGDLSVGGFFSLVNWRNDPEHAKHPRRSDYGLDEQTLALARLNPFYLIGQPRRPETRCVASVLSEISWE